MKRIHMFSYFLGASLVMMSHAVKNLGRFPYPCCGGEPRLDLHPGCENLWTYKNKNFAYIWGSQKDCRPPCARIEGAEMILKECVDVELRVWCTNAMNVVVEKRAFYYSKRCARPITTPHVTPHVNMAPDGQGSMFLMLFLMLMGQTWYMVH